MDSQHVLCLSHQSCELLPWDHFPQDLFPFYQPRGIDPLLITLFARFVSLAMIKEVGWSCSRHSKENSTDGIEKGMLTQQCAAGKMQNSRRSDLSKLGG